MWAASSVSSQTGSQPSQWGSSSSTLTAAGLCLQILVTAEMAFSVGLRFSIDRDSESDIILTSNGMASVGKGMRKSHIILDIAIEKIWANIYIYV